MKVILRRPIESLGAMGALVEVSEGYALNYLIPKKYAYLANAGNVRSLDEEKKVHNKRVQKEIADATALAGQIEQVSVQIPVQAGEDDRIFGTVTAQDIAGALKEKGFDIDKRKIELADQIKALGIFEVSIRLHARDRKSVV